MNPVEDIVKPMLGFLCIYGFLFYLFGYFLKSQDDLGKRKKLGASEGYD